MLKNYLITAWRNLKKNKGFFALNFLGLYISVVACILIGLIILHETSFDRPANKSMDVYRVVSGAAPKAGRNYNAVTPYPLAAALRTAMPGQQVLVSQINYTEKDVFSFGDKKFKEESIVFADSVFPRLFPVKVLEGSMDRTLSEPGFVALTETTAQKYFGKEDPVGRRVKLSNHIDLEVAAVVADPPANTHLRYHALVSWSSFDKDMIGGFSLDQWQLTAEGYTYVGLPAGSSISSTEKTLAALLEQHKDKADPRERGAFKLQPLSDIHYNQNYASSNFSYTTSFDYLYILGAIGLFLILAACINYTNLSTALAIRKSKEVGVRKTLGASRSHLMRQFLCETFLLTAIVILVAALSVRLFIPVLNTFLGKDIPLDWLTWKSGLLLTGLCIAVALLSGIYPAFVLSGFNPITALKSKMATASGKMILLRRGLVVFQFLTAQILLIGAIVVAKQMHYIQSQPLGFDKEKVVDIGLPENKPEQLERLRTELAAVPGISSFSISLGAPIATNNAGTEFNLREKMSVAQYEVAVKAVDKDYLKTYGLDLAAGRWFDANDEHAVGHKGMPDSLRHYAFVLNESAVKTLGFASSRDVLGKMVTFGFNNITAPVIGVVKDYHVSSMHDAMKPVLMVIMPFFYYNVGIKLSKGFSQDVLTGIERAWSSVYPTYVFESNFLDQDILALYQEERRTQQLFYLFTALSVIINALGLIGLLSFMVEQKRKEIGIRKVLGASIGNISLILSKDFLGLILIAFLIAAPVAGLVMSRWLQEFAFRTELSWWVFGLAVLAAVVITCISVGFQTVKAALANPVKSLRSE